MNFGGEFAMRICGQVGNCGQTGKLLGPLININRANFEKILYPRLEFYFYFIFQNSKK